MTQRTLTGAIDAALAQGMAGDDRIIVFGEDVRLMRRELLARFGPGRVRDTPISESAFLGAAVGAAMAGLRPVAELLMIDFAAVAFDALLNQAAKVAAFSGGRWDAPLVVRAPCGGGYGDGGQHEQALWGILGAVTGLTVAVASTPADAAGLMLSALEADGPVVLMEPKLLSDELLDSLSGRGARPVVLDIPAAGHLGEVPDPIVPVPLGMAAVRRAGADVTLVSVGVGVHRSLQAAERLADQGIDVGVVDLRTVAPLDTATLVEQCAGTGRVVVVDEDTEGFGLTGEVAAVLAERDVRVRYRRVATRGVIPFAPAQEAAALPNVDRIVEAANAVMA